MKTFQIANNVNTRAKSRSFSQFVNSQINNDVAKVSPLDTRNYSGKWGLQLKFNSGTLSLNK